MGPLTHGRSNPWEAWAGTTRLVPIVVRARVPPKALLEAGGQEEQE